MKQNLLSSKLSFTANIKRKWFTLSFHPLLMKKRKRIEERIEKEKIVILEFPVLKLNNTKSASY